MQLRLLMKPLQRPIGILHSVRLLLLSKRPQLHLMQRLKRQKQRLQHQMRTAVLPLAMPENLQMQLRSLQMMLLPPRPLRLKQKVMQNNILPMLQFLKPQVLRPLPPLLHPLQQVMQQPPQRVVMCQPHLRRLMRLPTLLR